MALKVKTLRKEQSITQSALSKKSGVSYGSIKRFETTGQISLESLLKIAHVLGRLEDFDLVLNKRDDNSELTVSLL
tara:strand:- start:121 stop:348 length:228 start_codon:yes stop_codon:yes gene_type:complete